MEYFNWKDLRLFRRDQATGKEERYDEGVGWVDVGNLVTREETTGTDVFWDKIDEGEVEKIFPGALAAGVATGVAETAQNQGAQGDSRFNALTVDDLSRIQGYVMGGTPVEKYIEDNEFEPGSEEARQATAFAASIKKSLDALEPGQTLHTPGEWT